jgi:H+-transporting ATPase
MVSANEGLGLSSSGPDNYRGTLTCDLSPEATTPIGLTSAEARRRLNEFGSNAVSEEAPSRWRVFTVKFWGPIPWMLEAAMVVEIGLGKYIEKAVIAGLLFFNATLGFAQEGRVRH